MGGQPIYFDEAIVGLMSRVPEGTLLGPTVFLTYIRNISKYIIVHIIDLPIK